MKGEGFSPELENGAPCPFEDDAGYRAIAEKLDGFLDLDGFPVNTRADEDPGPGGCLPEGLGYRAGMAVTRR